MITVIIHGLRLLLALYKTLKADHTFLALLISLVFYLAGGAAFYHFEQGWRWIDALYFCLTTIATIGGHGLVPTSDLAKVFTMIYLFIGVGLFYGVVFKVFRRSLALKGSYRQ